MIARVLLVVFAAGLSLGGPSERRRDVSARPPIARARVVVQGSIDESRFAALHVDVVDRRANGQLVLLVPADRLDALRALPGRFRVRMSTPARAL